MNNNLLFFLDLDDRTLFSNSIRSFFGFISKFIYKLFSGAIDLMYQLAAFDFGMNDFIETVSERLFSILIIFMIFKVSISIMSYLVNPDVAIDKDKGFQNIIKRVIISIILLISINPIFVVLKEVENAIIEDDIITTIFTTSDDEKVITAGKERIVGVRMSPHCPSNKMIYTATKGDRIALLLFRPFLQPYGEDDIRSANNGDTAWDTVFSTGEGKDMAHYCGYDMSSVKEIVLDLSGTDFKESFRDAIPGPNSAEGLLRDFYYNLGINEADTGYFANGDGTTSQYFFEFDYFFAFVLGIVGLLIVISFCFDVVIRSLNFIILQMIAPIPIISYVSPQGKSKEMLSAWWKKVMSVWASLFIRILCLSLAVLIIDGACNSLDNNDFGNASLLMQIFIILGVLMFAKKLPKLLEEIIPGLKIDGGFELNPLKRIQNDALGGKMIVNGAQRLTRGASALAMNTAMGAVAGQGVGHALWSGVRGAAAGVFGNQRLGDIRKNQADYNRKMRMARLNGSTLGGRFRAGIDEFIGTEGDMGRIIAAENNYDSIIEQENNAILANKQQIANTTKITDNIKSMQDRAVERIKEGRAGNLSTQYLSREAELERMKEAFNNGQNYNGNLVTANQIAVAQAQLTQDLENWRDTYISNAITNPNFDGTMTSMYRDYQQNIATYGTQYGYAVQATGDTLQTQMSTIKADNSIAARANIPHERNISNAESGKDALKAQKRVAQANADMPMRPPGFHGGGHR